MTLEDFKNKILTPTLIKAIKEGRVDNALTNPDCIEIILKDEELLKAYKHRMENEK